MKRIVIILLASLVVITACDEEVAVEDFTNNNLEESTVSYETDGLLRYETPDFAFYSSLEFSTFDGITNVFVYYDEETEAEIYVSYMTREYMEINSDEYENVQTIDDYYDYIVDQALLLESTNSMVAFNGVPKKKLEVYKSDYTLRGLNGYVIKYVHLVTNYDELDDDVKQTVQPELVIREYVFPIDDAFLVVKTYGDYVGDTDVNEILETIYFK